MFPQSCMFVSCLDFVDEYKKGNFLQHEKQAEKLKSREMKEG